jgi:hypothetical protein
MDSLLDSLNKKFTDIKFEVRLDPDASLKKEGETNEKSIEPIIREESK